MTLRIVDVSRHQVERRDPLSLVVAQRAGIGAVNIQLDRGRQVDVLPVWASGYAAAARELGLAVCTYRWLDGRLPGRDSARIAYDRMIALGGPDGIAHAVDTEETADKGPPATERIIREYVEEMTFLLGRPIALYTGDWWWTGAGRNWRMADSAPYLWAAPNTGYLGEYPGDDSPHWTAGYGGWPTLSVMQYAVKPLAGTGDCSFSAVRDMAVWQTLTGGNMRARNMQALTDDIQDEWPGTTVWGKGDLAHQGSASDHNEDDTSGSRPEQVDADNVPEHRAIDVPFLGPFNLNTARALRARLTERPTNARRLRYVILEQNIWRKRNGWKREDYTGTYHNHLHVSGDAADDENGAGWDIGPAAPVTPKPPPSTAAGNNVNEEEDTVLITFVYAKVGGQDRWGLGVVSGGEKFWFEANSQERADAYSITLGKSAKVLSSGSAYDAEKAQFVGTPA